MKAFSYVIKDELGIHARPAGLLVKEAKKYDSKIIISVGDKSTEVKGIMGVMLLCVESGNEVKVTAEGTDEEIAIEGLKSFFETNL